MGGNRPKDGKQITAFPINGLYLFKHYFTDGFLFNELKEYYNNQQYRFEVPDSEFNSTRLFLEDRGYEFTIADDIEKYIVVVKKYSYHPENIFKDSVIQKSVSDYHCFLMKNESSLKQAINNEAIAFSQTDLENPFI